MSLAETLHAYTALIYPVAHPGAHRVTFRAECVQYPGIVAERDTPQNATEALRQDLIVAIAAGEPETTGDVVITTITVSKPDGKGGALRQAYTAVVTPDTDDGFAAFCPALGVATDGRSLDEALTMLEDAANLHLLDQPLLAHDIQVIIAQAGVSADEFLQSL